MKKSRENHPWRPLSKNIQSGAVFDHSGYRCLYRGAVLSGFAPWNTGDGNQRKAKGVYRRHFPANNGQRSLFQYGEFHAGTVLHRQRSVYRRCGKGDDARRLRGKDLCESGCISVS